MSDETTLRDRVKDGVRETFLKAGGTQDIDNFVANVADSVFDALMISEEVQDLPFDEDAWGELVVMYESSVRMLHDINGGGEGGSED